MIVWLSLSEENNPHILTGKCERGCKHCRAEFLNLKCQVNTWFKWGEICIGCTQINAALEQL